MSDYFGKNANELKNKKLWFFDLDGTILDSSKVWKKVDSDFFKMHNMNVPSDYLENISAMNIFDIAKYTINRFNFPYSINELVDKWNDMARTEYEENILIKPYVRDYLLKLKSSGVKLGIATALDEKIHDALLSVPEGIANLPAPTL